MNDQLLERIRIHIAYGAVMAAAATAGAVGGATVSCTVNESRYPLVDLSCHGKEGEFVGQCCGELVCIPHGTERRCAAYEQEMEAEILDAGGYEGLGSGECLCEISGPHNPEGAPGSDGMCCYAVFTQSCEGRPFRVRGEIRLAAAVRRTDWV